MLGSYNNNTNVRNLTNVVTGDFNKIYFDYSINNISVKTFDFLKNITSDVQNQINNITLDVDVQFENIQNQFLGVDVQFENIQEEINNIPQGPQGPQGPVGNIREQGPVGLTPQLSIGTVQSASIPSVTITDNTVLNFELVRGEKGERGRAGDSSEFYAEESELSAIASAASAVLSAGFAAESASAAEIAVSIAVEGFEAQILQMEEQILLLETQVDTLNADVDALQIDVSFLKSENINQNANILELQILTDEQQVQINLLQYKVGIDNNFFDQLNLMTFD